MQLTRLGTADEARGRVTDDSTKVGNLSYLAACKRDHSRRGEQSTLEPLHRILYLTRLDVCTCGNCCLFFVGDGLQVLVPSSVHQRRGARWQCLRSRHLDQRRRVAYAVGPGEECAWQS